MSKVGRAIGMSRIEHSGTVIKSEMEEVGCDQPRDYLLVQRPRVCRLGWQLLKQGQRHKSKLYLQL